jgi:hypothetical protein
MHYLVLAMVNVVGAIVVAVILDKALGMFHIDE